MQLTLSEKILLEELFLEMLVSERGASKNTVISYRHDLREWFYFLKELHPCKATFQEAKAYIDFLYTKSFKARSIARRISALRQFYYFLLIENHITYQPFEKIFLPNFSKGLPKILSITDIQQLIFAAQQDPSPEGRRLWTLIELLYATGMRISELISLSLNVVNPLFSIPPEEMLCIKGKGGHERLVFVTKQAIEALKAYLIIRPVFCNKKNANYLFPSCSKEGYITRQRVGQLLKHLAIQANLDPSKISPHVLRHAFATHLLQNGIDLISLQTLLGHKDISTTQIYTHVDRTKLLSVLEAYHPLVKSTF